MLVFLPVLVLLNQVPVFDRVPHAPVSIPYAPMYAILLSLPFQREKVRLRWCWTDTIVVALMFSGAMTGLLTEVAETAVNAFRNDVLRLAMPYFLARAVFRDWHVRRAALWVLVGLTGVVAAAAAVEFLYTPNFYLHLLQRAGMGNSIHSLAMRRFGFSRVSGTVEHPIFFGNMFVVVLGMVAVLARTSGVRLAVPAVALGLAGAAACVGMSGSFTPWLGVSAGSAALAVLLVAPVARRALLPLTVCVVIGLFAYTYHLATAPAGRPGHDRQPQRHRRQPEHAAADRPPVVADRGHGRVVRVRPAGGLRRAGGLRPGQRRQQLHAVHHDPGVGLHGPVDRHRGWRSRPGRSGPSGVMTDRSQAFPLAVCTATVLGLMMSMYTVWAGAEYTVVWVIMLGLSQALIDTILASAEARAGAAPRAAGRVRPPAVGRPTPARYGVRVGA